MVRYIAIIAILAFAFHAGCKPAHPAKVYADPTFDPAVHAFIETRRVNITIEAHSVNDPDREVRLQESVLIRTNRVSNPSP